jgi:hypothetical protein
VLEAEPRVVQRIYEMYTVQKCGYAFARTIAKGFFPSFVNCKQIQAHIHRASYDPLQHCVGDLAVPRFAIAGSSNRSDAFEPGGGVMNAKTLHFFLQNVQKYNPRTFIFDIGGSFQSLTFIFGRSYLKVGQESPDFTINPFHSRRTKTSSNFSSASGACSLRAAASVTAWTSGKNANCGM